MHHAGCNFSISRELANPLREDPFFARCRRQARVHRVVIRSASRVDVREQERVTLRTKVRQPDAGKSRFSPRKIVIEINQKRVSALAALREFSCECRFRRIEKIKMLSKGFAGRIVENLRNLHRHILPSRDRTDASANYEGEHPAGLNVQIELRVCPPTILGGGTCRFVVDRCA